MLLHGTKDTKMPSKLGKNKTNKLKIGNKFNITLTLLTKSTIEITLNSNITPNGTSKEETNTVLVHAETSGINHHSPLLMPKVLLENIIYPTVKFTHISMDNTSMLTILNGQTQMLKLITTVHGSVLQILPGKSISHKTAHGLMVNSLTEV
jgi:hypothetical protein